ncbi:metallophosphoesterase [Chloroflexia bacterium SDU3-3]|nr:metallophosphoesterase [Chloroflexia bacterium SDU3-3]
MHVSDLHAGRPFNNDVAAQLAKEAHALKPDLLVVSGDMVQRADFVVQWQVITSYLRHLPEPKLIIPGNHDVPLFNVFNRLFRPYARYQKYISPNLNPVFELPGLAVVGGCSAHGLTIDGGKVSKAQLAQLEQIFSRYPSGVCKVAVLHHHVVAPPGSEGRRMISNAEEVAQMLDRCGVELMLCGHIHVSYVGSTLDVRPDLERGTIICQSGTSTSRRGKGREAGRNSYNVIEIDDTVIRIAQHLYSDEAGRFVPVADHVFPRRTAGIYMLPRDERVVQE